MTTVANGVNVQALLDAREVLKGAPEAAQFTWRASAKWQSGVHSTIKVQSFFGLGEEQSHKEESDVRSRPPRGLRGGGQRHHADRVPPRRPGELPQRGRGVRRAEPRHPAALGRVDGRGRARHPRHPRCRQRRPQRLQRHQGDVPHRRGRVAARTSRRWWPSPRSAPPCSTRSRTRRTSPSKSPEGPGHRAASPRSSSARGTRASPRATSSATGRSTTSCSSAARWRTPGGANAGTPCGCSLPTGKPPAGPSLRRPGPGRLHDGGRGDRVHRALRHGLARSRPDAARTSRRCGAPTTATA